MDDIGHSQRYISIRISRVGGSSMVVVKENEEWLIFFWQKRTSVEVIANLASSILQEFWVHWPSFNAKLTQHNSEASGTIRWLLPKYGHFKINVDAAVGGDQTGIGVLARDSQGIITRAMAQYLSRCPSALTMEVQAVIQWLCLARKCNLSPMGNRN